MRRATLSIGILIVGLAACSNPFAPKKKPGQPDLPVEPTTPDLVIELLGQAMRNRDEQLYEKLLDESFWFTEDDCTGELVWQNGREEELEFIAGSRDGSEPGIFDIYRKTFDFSFTLISRPIELGIEYPDAFPGDPDGHPDEDWEVFRGRVQMLLTDENDDGFRVDQVMNYKLREVAPTSTDTLVLWKIVRWVDDPLAGECSGSGDAKPASPISSWSSLKQTAQ